MELTIPKKVVEKLIEIKEDCIKLEKENNLTEYGKGELHILNLILK